MRRLPPVLFLLLLFLFSACADEKTDVASLSRPDFIIILADDLGYGDLGCFGNDRFKTPNIDALAAGGIRFTDFHSNSGVCSPTRAALLTGRYQQRSGINRVFTARNHRDTGLAPEETTLAEVLKPAGYRTALFGKWHLGYPKEYNPVHQGFDEFVGFLSGNVDYRIHIDQTGREDWWKQDRLTPEEGYTTDLMTDHAIDFIERNKDEPFLIYLAQAAPHYPYQGRDDPPKYTPGQGRDRSKDRFDIEIYREMIEVMDEDIGRVVEAVEEAGLKEKTLIVFFSDNGPVGRGSTGPFRGEKGSSFEGGHRVPALAYWPGRIRAGRVSDVTAMGADLFPTIAEAAGAKMPAGVTIDGVSLLSHLTEEEPLEPRYLYWGIKEELTVRHGDYKLISDEEFSRPQLYDLKTDIGEKEDVAEQHPELVKELVEKLKAWHRDVTEGVEERTVKRFHIRPAGAGLEPPPHGSSHARRRRRNEVSD